MTNYSRLRRVSGFSPCVFRLFPIFPGAIRLRHCERRKTAPEFNLSNLERIDRIMTSVISPQIAALIICLVAAAGIATYWFLRPVHHYGYKHLFNALRETTFDSVFILDGEGRIQAANEVAVDAFGQTIDEMHDQPLSSLFVREDEGRYAGVVEADAVLERDFYRNSRTIHAMAVGPGQREFHAELRVRPVFGSLRPRFVVVAREVTPKISIGRSATSSDQKYRRMFNQEQPIEREPMRAQSAASQQQ